MEIQEKDFKIIKEGSNLVLYVLKSRKELKEDDKSSFKIGGYYITLLSALRGALKFRRDKKYPGKESSKELAELIQTYKESITNLDEFSNLIYNPILELKSKLIKYE